MIGREILRSRGMDPDLAFGDPNDSRLAMVPIMSFLLDSINREWNKQGIQLDSVAWVERGATQQQVSNGNSVSITQDKRVGETIFDCAADVGGHVLAVFGTAYTGLSLMGVTGAAVVGGVTGGQALGVVGLWYWAYRSGQCAGDKLLRSPDCSITMPIPCDDIIRTGPDAFRDYWGFYDNHPYQQCVKNLTRQALGKMGGLNTALGDTLAIVVTYNK